MQQVKWSFSLCIPCNPGTLISMKGVLPEAAPFRLGPAQDGCQSLAGLRISSDGLELGQI